MSTTNAKNNKRIIRKPYDDRVRLSITFPDETMAMQSFKEECDINTILAKYNKTGILEHVQKVQGSYGDFTNVQEYQLNLNQVIAAQDAFDALPAKIRERFANDPARLMTFLNDEKNLDEAVSLGLVEAPEPPQAQSPSPAKKGSKEPSTEPLSGDTSPPPQGGAGDQ